MNDQCAECGMPCEPGEYHPFAACLMFKACHNSTTVRANLAAVSARAALEAQAEPAGWKWVPVEPTPEMLAAIEHQWMYGSAADMAVREYRAMLAAAPQQPPLAAPSAQQAAQPLTWRSIKTAPKDGTHILAILPDADTCYVICWCDPSAGIREHLREAGEDVGWRMAFDGWPIDELSAPTHWMPLPERPAGPGGVMLTLTAEEVR